MANVPDNKKGLSLIKRTRVIITSLEANDVSLQSIKTAYQNANPDVNVEGFPMAAQEVSDANAMITAYNDFITAHATTITMLKNKNVGSHKGNALD